MNEEKHYFFPPKWDFNHDGPISLGNILADPRTPHHAITRDSHLPPLSFSINSRTPKFKVKLECNPKQSPGINLSVLSLFGLGTDAPFDRCNKQEYIIEAESRLMQEIDPSAECVKACFEQPAMKRHFVEKGYKDVYMITGIMAATKATVSSRSARRTLFGGRLGVNGAAVEVPLGVETNPLNKGGGEAKVAMGKSDFVLAYRLRKITYLKGRRVKIIEEDLKGKWKRTVLNGDVNGETGEPETEYDAKFVRLDGAHVGAEEFDLAGVGARDEDAEEAFEFVVPLEQPQESARVDDNEQ